MEHGSQAVDFRGEALTFKATTAGVLARLQHCLDLFNQSQEGWKRRLEREVDKRKKVEELYRQALEELRVVSESKSSQSMMMSNGISPMHYQQQLSSESKRIVLVGGPDYQEGPHSTIAEDEFYDAVEAGLDKIDEEQQYLEKLKNKQVVRFASQAPAHPLWPEVKAKNSHVTSFYFNNYLMGGFSFVDRANNNGTTAVRTDRGGRWCLAIVCGRR